LSRRLHIEAAGRTDAGRVRKRNDDAFALHDDLDLYMIADGIGGQPDGNVAATTALEIVRSYLADPDSTWPPDATATTDRFSAAVMAANHAIHSTRAGEPPPNRMGTTFAGVLFDEGRACIAHVGDSRVYRFRDGALGLLTEDHTWIAHMLGKGTPIDVAEQVPFKHALMRTVGIEERVKVSTRFERVLDGDLFLLCSDGLSKPVERAEIATILAEAGDLPATVDRLIDRTNERGGPDNVTAVLVRVREPA
jgi:PPM family protein phosphatase